MGKTINCEVTSVNHNSGRIEVKRLSDANMYKKPREFLQGKPKSLKIGGIYKARITAVRQKAFEVVVECNREDVTCLVPFYHLTDCQAMTETIKITYQVNDYLNKVMYAYDDPNTGLPILTKKETLKSAYMSNKYMDTFAGLTKDCDILGVVKSFEEDYMLVDTLVKDCNRCVVPLNKIFLPEGDQLQDILEVGQTIVTQMVSKVEDEREVTATCDLTGDKHISRNYLTEYLRGLLENFSYLRLLEKYKALRTFTIGWVYQATVKSVTDVGATLEMEGGVTALAPASNFGHNKPEPEAEIDVLVLFVDYQSGVLEVCCDETLVKPVLEVINAQNFASLRGIGVGTVMKGEIVLTRTELNLQLLYVMDPPRYKGKIVYVPDLYEETDETNTGSKRNVVEVSVKFRTTRRECIGTDEQEILSRKREIEPSTDVSNKKIKTEIPKHKIPDELYRLYLGKKAAEKYIKKEIKQEVDDTTFSSVVNMNFSEDNKDDIVMMDTSMSAAPSKTVLEDPGWDFSVTKITLPAWGKVEMLCKA
jgi:ribosomal protein S1